MGARPSSDMGDYDSSEVRFAVPNVWHQSHNDAVIQKLPAKTSAGIEYLKGLRQQMAVKPVPVPSRTPVNLTCWKDTPQLYRQVVVRVAGLSADVVKKIDRDLTESEKVLIRAAIRDMREHFAMLASL